MPKAWSLTAAQPSPPLSRGAIASSPMSTGAMSTGVLVSASLDSVVAIGLLAACALAFGVPFGGSYMILALLVFSMTFPGVLPRDPAGRNLAFSILARWSAVVVLLLFLGWATQTVGNFDERVIFAWALATPFAQYLAHRAVPGLLPRMMAAEGRHKVSVIAGASALGASLASRIEAMPWLGIRFAGYFDDRDPSRLQDLGEPVMGAPLGTLGDLPQYAKKHRIDQIYITLPMASQPRILKLLDELKDTTASIYFVPDIFMFDLIQARMDSIGGMPVVAVCETPLFGVNALIKRASDVLIAGAILAMISPVMLAVAIGVKRSSPGPVLFKQRRYGLDGREIVVYKFRSMTVTEDGDVVRQATRQDARVTPFGAFLRRTSLDELPQFINVLQGRMSVVGPRPHAVAHNEMYRKLISGYMIRHKVKPGITGLAQVNGLRGETDTVEKMKARVEHDLVYLRNWSVWLDLVIVIKTVFVVLRDRNAY
jgi:putative colanic acid biosynthesis UDP-glucose lipid carrier transferase